MAMHSLIGRTAVLAVLTAVFCAAVFLPFADAAKRSSKNAPPKKSGEIGYANVKVRDTGIEFPRLTRFHTKSVIKKVNTEIDQITAQFGCEEDSRTSYYKVRSKVEYADRDIFSIYASAEYYCGGAYPTNDSNISVTFDLKTGRTVQFENLFRNYALDRRKILGTIFAAQIQRSASRPASKKIGEYTCEGDPHLYSLGYLEKSDFSFSFSKEGLRVQPQWPHVIESCSELVTIPYSRLRKFAAPGGLLMRAAE